jgi:Histidine kinase-, DNA gyrase B-, and HSP90-like ATPase
VCVYRLCNVIETPSFLGIIDVLTGWFLTIIRAITGYVDREGRLIAADPRLLVLQIAAGGVEGGALVIPQLASLARIARSLAIPISRPVIIADGDRTVEVLARARLEDAIVHLVLSDIDAVEPLESAVDLSDPNRAADFARLEGEGRWETDATLTITSMSAGLGTLLGTPMPDAVGKSLGSVFTPIAGPDGDVPILSALVQHIAFTGQWAALALNPAKKVLLTGAPMDDTGGGHRGYHGTVRPAEAFIQDGVQGAQISSVAQRLDTALRAPIGRIIGNADAINAGQEGALKPEYLDYASDISSAGRHLLGLVDDLVDLQAIERADFKVDHDPIDIADIARRAAGLLSVRAADSKVRIDKPDDDEELPARGEFRRVLQILVNLIGNAVRYSPENAMVWIRTEQDGDLAVIVVADQGKGIAVADQARIFEKFERVDTDEPGGSGLGLYIARRLARAMGGDITVDSAPGLGARFALTLPADV